MSDPYWNSVVLACHFDGSNGATTFTDEKGHTLTAKGGAQLTTTSPQFGTACATLDGTGDYIVAATSADFVVGAAEFTLEAWFYFAGFASNHAYGAVLLDLRPVGSLTSGMVLFANASGVLTARDSNATANQSASGKVAAGNWYHIAICRANGRMRVFVNGVAVIDYAHAINYAPASTTLIVGTAADYQDTSANYKHNGKVDDLRFTKGVARYTADFSVPAEAFPNRLPQLHGTVKDQYGNFAARPIIAFSRNRAGVTYATTSDAMTGEFTLPVSEVSEHVAIALPVEGDPHWSNVVLAMHMDDEGLTDLKGHAVTLTGNAARSAAQSKFGGYSAYFDGTGDRAAIAAGSDFTFGTGDFTIEFWYRQTVAGTASLVDCRPNSTTNGAYVCLYIDASAISLYVNSAVRITSAVAVTTGTWYHVAVCRSNGVTRLYINGTQTGAAYADATSYISAPVNIGASGSLASVLNGYIDDLRITKGVARYFANFTPPSSAFPHAVTGGTENALILDNLIPV